MATVLNARTIHLHDIEARWNLTKGFIPRQGELVIYDKDNKYSYERFKIGDGTTDVKNLPFVTDVAVKNFFMSTDDSEIIYIDGGKI